MSARRPDARAAPAGAVLALAAALGGSAGDGTAAHALESAAIAPPRVLAAAGGFEIRSGETVYATFEAPPVRGAAPAAVEISDAPDGWSRVRMSWQLAEPVAQDDLAIVFRLALTPDLHWIPHLAPEEGMVAAQHVFRAPAVIVAQAARTLVLVPDLDLVGTEPDTPWYLDYDAPRRRAAIGMARTSVSGHVFFAKQPGMVLGPGTVELGFFVAAYEDDAEPRNPWRHVSRFLWQRWARPLLAAGQPTRVPLRRYVEHTYDWAFDRWQAAVWQELELDGVRVGAPQFIVNVTQSPSYPGTARQREFLSIWNQAWFSSLRSASGLLRWARRTGREDLAERARLTKALALAAPMRDGLFPSVLRTDNREVTVDGELVRRPAPWSEAYWTNSNRTPKNLGITADWYHVLDASWTALTMLRWYRELEPDPALLRYARTWADRLLRLQDERGFFPAWLDPETQEPSTVYRDSPETSLSVTFLLELADTSGEPRYRERALRAMAAVLQGPVMEGRWEDFETYWSCNAFGRDTLVGRRIERNGLYKQNTLSMFWTAEALLASWRASGDDRFLAWGRRTLDELAMAQQVWQPPFIQVPAVGGFGVMNADGEWNDARQSLFAELYMDYYRVTGEPELFERGAAALQVSFAMMYAPENPRIKEQWEKAHPFFGPADYGFTMENYGHNGTTSAEGVGIGEFTIYDWGNGAASEAYNRVIDHYGQVYLDRARGLGFGIDSVAVESGADGFRLRDLAEVEAPRAVRVVFEDGSARDVRLDGTVVIRPGGQPAP